MQHVKLQSNEKELHSLLTIDAPYTIPFLAPRLQVPGGWAADDRVHADASLYTCLTCVLLRLIG